MMRATTVIAAFGLSILFVGCGGSSGSGEEGEPTAVLGDQVEHSETGGCAEPESCGGQRGVTPTQPVNLDRHCDLAEYPSADWSDCEARNFARTLEAQTEQLSPMFQQRSLAQSVVNFDDWTQRSLTDSSWLDPRSGNTFILPLCTTWALPCQGDPFRYPGIDGPDGTIFYEQEAEVTDVVFYDRDCARLSGRVWLPKQAPNRKLPNIVITNGSVQAPQTVYWWVVQPLVRAGYAVLTYDPRGQGRSDQQAPNLEQGSNANPRVFWEGQVDAIDFFRSSPNHRYPHQAHCAGTYPTETRAFNPIWDCLDPDRLGIAGHSLGAIGVSVVQGYDGQGADPWPGHIDARNPVRVAVAWDSLITPNGEGLAPTANTQLPPEVHDAMMLAIAQGVLPKFAPRVPSMGFFADYAVLPTPYMVPPDEEANNVAFRAWQEAGVPVYALGFQGTTHFDYSLLPDFPATSWCPDVSGGACRGGWGRPSIEYYTVAWFDRWLKRPGEPGYRDADLRLVDDAWGGGSSRMSFHYHSARDYPDRSGKQQHCEVIRAGCP